MPRQESPCPAEPTCSGVKTKAGEGNAGEKGLAQGHPTARSWLWSMVVPVKARSSDIAPTGIYHGMKTLPLPGCYFGMVKGLVLSHGCHLGLFLT